MHHDKTHFYGTATVGTKGQLVIPVEAREALNIKTGDRLAVLGGKVGNMICIIPIDQVEKLLTELTHKVETMRKLVNNTKKREG